MLNLRIITEATQPAAPNLSTYTIVQLKEWARVNGFRAPSGLKKAELVQYLTGAYQEKTAGVTREQKNPSMAIDVLQPRIVDPALEWPAHLLTHGWAVAPILGWNPAFTNMFMDWLASCSPEFKPGDPATWKTKNMPVMLHGIVKQYFGHTEMQWQIRELCAPIFARIWGCTPEHLLCSYDGGCFLPASPEKRSFKNWIHNDQPRYFPDFVCVQGIVNFVENGPEDGGLVLVEGSHTIFGEYMARHPSEGITWGPADMSDPALATRRLIKICAPPGHIILFDSRTFHCNVHPCSSVLRPDGTPRFRMCTYVSMQPRAGATAKELEKRRRLYETGRMTGHWCYGHYFKETAENPRTYGGEINKPATVEIAPLTPLRMRLIGYD